MPEQERANLKKENKKKNTGTILEIFLVRGSWRSCCENETHIEVGRQRDDMIKHIGGGWEGTSGGYKEEIE